LAVSSPAGKAATSEPASSLSLPDKRDSDRRSMEMAALIEEQQAR
jgi:hypothetical protein